MQIGNLDNVYLFQPTEVEADEKEPSIQIREGVMEEELRAEPNVR